MSRNKPEHKRRGVALLVVLMMTTVIFMMVLALYTSSRGGVFSSLEQQKRVAALYVAEAGLAETMEALEASSFATPPSALTGTLPSGGTWRVAFNDSGPAWTPSESVNNLANGGYASSYRGTDTVPPYSALIVVEAKVGGVERQIEGIISRGGGGPSVSHALQSAGRVRLDGDVLVDGVTSLLDATPVPGSVHSNAGSGTPIQWTGSGAIDISGTVTAQGGTIDLQGYVPGGGAPSTGSTAPFPAVDVQAEIAAKTSAPPPVIVPFGTTTVSGADHYYSGDLTINGDLVLDGAALYVDGELNVNGSISGEGSVYVGEKTSFKGDARVLADTGNNVSLYSRDSVTLSGFDGEAYLQSLADADTSGNFGKYWTDAKDTIQEMQVLLTDPSHAPADFFTGGSQNAPLDELRRTLGQSMPGPVVPGRQRNTLGLISQHISAQPPGPTQQFLAQKFESMRRFYMPGDELNGDVQAMSDWQNGLYDRGGTMDGMLDTGNHTIAAALFPEMVAYTEAIEYDKLASSYFRGLVYTNGFIHAHGEITVVGAVLADGDPNMASATLPDGNTANPGDVILQDNTRVTFLEDLGQGMGGTPGSNVSVETWIGR